MQLGLAFQAFFAALFNSEVAEQIRDVLAAPASGERAEKPPASEELAAEEGRSDAVTLLASLQREARFVDMIQEPLGEYSDAQIGAAARDVLRDCRAVLDRFFSLEPLVSVAEGSEWETPDNFDAEQCRLTGGVAGDPPFRGTVRHHGWHATRCELPQWHGSSESNLVIAPVELEVS